MNLWSIWKAVLAAAGIIFVIGLYPFVLSLPQEPWPPERAKITAVVTRITLEQRMRSLSPRIVVVAVDDAGHVGSVSVPGTANNCRIGQHIGAYLAGNRLRIRSSECAGSR